MLASGGFHASTRCSTVPIDVTESRSVCAAQADPMAVLIVPPCLPTSAGSQVPCFIHVVIGTADPISD